MDYSKVNYDRDIKALKEISDMKKKSAEIEIKNNKDLSEDK